MSSLGLAEVLAPVSAHHSVFSTQSGLLCKQMLFSFISPSVMSVFGFGKPKLLARAFHPLYTEGLPLALRVEQTTAAILPPLSSVLSFMVPRDLLASCFHRFPTMKMFFVRGGHVRTDWLLNIDAYDWYCYQTWSKKLLFFRRSVVNAEACN